MYYIGLDVHKRKISYCVKDGSGKVHAEGWIPATRFDLDRWMKTLRQPWSAAMEATVFSGWIYDHLKPHAAAVLGRSHDRSGGMEQATRTDAVRLVRCSTPESRRSTWD